MSKSVSFAPSLVDQLDLLQSRLALVRSAVLSLETLENQFGQSESQILSDPAALMRFQREVDLCSAQFEQIGDLTQDLSLQKITLVARSRLEKLLGRVSPVTLHQAEAISVLCSAEEPPPPSVPPVPFFPSPKGFKHLPATLLHHVSTFLTPSELGYSFRICKEWGADKRNNNIWRLQLERAGRAQWRKCLGDPGEVPPLPANIRETLQAHCRIFDGPVWQNYLLVLIPSTLTFTDPDGAQHREPLTLTLLDRLVRSSPKGNGRAFSNLSNVEEALRNRPAAPSHWVLIGKKLVPGSDNDYSFFEGLAHYVVPHGFEAPPVLDVSVGIFLNNLLTGSRLFAFNKRRPQWSQVTVCQETDSWNKHLAVGAFDSEGLDISSQQMQVFLGTAYGPGITPTKRL